GGGQVVISWTPPAVAPAVTGVSPASSTAGAGATLTVSGSGFASGATVQLTAPDGTATSLTPASSNTTSLSVSTPSLTAGTWYVAAINPPGGSALTSNVWPLYVTASSVSVTGENVSSNGTATTGSVSAAAT